MNPSDRNRSRALGQASLSIVGVLLIVLMIGTVVLPMGTAGPLGGVMLSALVFFAAAATFRRARLRDAERPAWLAMTLALGLWAAAQLAWTVHGGGTGARVHPSVADALYLAYYPACFASLLLLLRSRLTRLPVSMWTDGVIAGLGVAALAVGVLYDFALKLTHADPTSTVVVLAYPLGDLVLIGFAALTFAVDNLQRSRRTALIHIGLLCHAAASLMYILPDSERDGVALRVLGLLYAIAPALIALAAWRPPPPRERGVMALWTSQVTPAIFLPLAAGVLVRAQFTPTRNLAVLLAGGTLLAIGLRTLILFRENAALLDSRWQATTDELTGLANRRAFNTRLGELVGPPGEEGDGDGPILAVLMIDMDRFKELNDTLGHAAGDAMLRELAPRLQQALPEAEMVARLGGDEFAAVLTCADTRTVEDAITRIGEQLDRPFMVDGVDVLMEASIGVARAPEDGRTMDELLQRADVAMYRAKAGRTGAEHYDATSDGNSRERLAMVADLRRAIDEHELVVHFQPKGDLRSGEIIGVEALVRWQHPVRGLLAPGDFLPQAERTGLMRPLTHLVLDDALAQLARWRDNGHKLTVAVNLSVPNLLDRRLPDDVAVLLARHGVEPSNLTLEVTETLLMVDPIRAEAVLRRLEQLGVRISLDDFGTGFSSLSHLRRLPVNELKIDRSFVTNLVDGGDDLAIVRSVIGLARALGISVVAEGVEHAGTWQALRANGCELAQGYFLSRPAPAAELGDWLAARPQPAGDPTSPLEQTGGVVGFGRLRLADELTG